MADHTDPGIEKTVGLTVNVLLCGRTLELGRPSLAMGPARRNGTIRVPDPGSIKREVRSTDLIKIPPIYPPRWSTLSV